MSGREPTDVEHLIAQAAGLRRLAVRLVGEGDADDVLQDAVAAGIAHAPAEREALKPWLVRVVRNLAASRHRSDAPRRERERAVARPERQTSTTDVVARMEVQRLVAEEVLRLDEPYRTAVLTVYFEGVGAADFARERGVPAATVRSWLARGLETLRRRLDGRFGGDRAAWSACLLPLARPDVPIAVAGGIVVKKLVVAAALVLIATLAWWVSADARDPALVAGTGAPGSDLAEPVSDHVVDALAPLDRAERRTEAVSALIAAATGRVTGRVTWSPDGAPAAGIGVRLVAPGYEDLDEEPPHGVTDGDGRFAFVRVAPGAHDVLLDRCSAQSALVVERGGQHEVELAIERADDVVGRVLDPDGNPVPGAEVHMRESNRTWMRRIAIAGADGGFRIVGADAQVELCARAAGRAPSGTSAVPAQSPRTLDLYLGAAAARVTGVVLDARGDPRSGVLVCLVPTGASGVDPAGRDVVRGAERTLRTDARGRFDFPDAQPGTCLLRIRVAESLTLDETVLARPNVVTETAIRLPALARVHGRVVDADARPPAQARVSVGALERRGWASATCDADGRFDVRDVPAGRVMLTAASNGGRVEVQELVLAPGEEREWSPVLGAPISIRGRLVDVAGAPLAARAVTLSDERTTETDADGRFAFETPQIQTYTVWFADGALTSRREKAMPGVREVVLVADECRARVVGRVVDSQGKPRAGVQLECDDVRAKTAADGAFELAGVRAGPCVIEAPTHWFPDLALATLDVRTGALHDVGDVVLADHGSLRVRARSEEGVPIGWTAPMLRRVGPGVQWVGHRGWGARGEMTVADLPAGEYELALRDGLAAMQTTTVTIRAGERAEVELELRFGASCEIEVRAASGAAPFDDVELEIRDAGGALVGRRSSRVPFATPVSVERALLAPGSYVCSVRVADGRTGRTRIEVGRQGAPRARVELR